jgi:hypothetical protein
MAFRAAPSEPSRRLRSRAVSLIEAIFYLTVTASVLTLTAQIMDREARRAKRTRRSPPICGR